MRPFLLSLLILLLGLSVGKAQESGRQSFVIFYADDLRWDCLGCAGHPHLKTPNIDRIAQQGTSFKNSFVTTAICAVSRASLITGRYARTHRVGDFRTPLAPHVLASSLPAVLKRAGYAIACFGKWGIGGPLPRELFDAWDAWSGQGKFFHNVDGREIHNSEYLALRAEQFLRDCPTDQPFCLLVYYKGPHDPFKPDRRDEHIFDHVIFDTPKTYNDVDLARFPAFIRRSEGRTRLMKRHPTPGSYQQFVRNYLGCIASIDRSVGQVTKSLQDSGRAEETVVLFTSDHGFFLGEHGMSGKWLMHEESIRVPLLIDHPKLRESNPAQVSEELALNIDVAPTILEMAGLPAPNEMDGRSLWPVLQGNAEDWRKDFFYEHHFNFGGRIPRTEGVRSKDWKYITYPGEQPHFEELYDLRNDPLEQNNLIRDGTYRRELVELRKSYRAYVESFPPPALPGG